MSAFKSYVLGYIHDVPTVTLPEMEAVMEDIATRKSESQRSRSASVLRPGAAETACQRGLY
jgi:hypothetical protein